MDGTLFDYHGQLLRDLKSLQSPSEPEIEDLFAENTPWIKRRMNFIKSRPGWWRDLPKLQLGWDVLNAAKALSYEIQILTKAPRTKKQSGDEVFSHYTAAWAEKVQCIDMHLGPNTTISMVSGKDEENKSSAKSGIYGRVLVEDFPEYLEGWLQYRPRGLGILIDNKSNAGYEHPSVIRYNGTEESLAFVNRALNAAFKRKDKQHWREVIWEDAKI